MDITKFLKPEMVGKITHLPPEALKYLLKQIDEMPDDNPLKPKMLKISEIANKTLSEQKRKSQPVEKRQFNIRRYFYLPLNRILFDGDLEVRENGAISRFSMEKIWFYILTKLMTEEAEEFEQAFKAAMQEKKMKKAKLVVSGFNVLVGEKLEAVIKQHKGNERDWSRFAMIIGNKSIAEDAEDISYYLQNISEVEQALKFFPAEIEELNGGRLAITTDEIIRVKKTQPRMLGFYISLLINSLKQPAHALRIIKKYYRIDHASAASQCDLAIIGEMVLFSARVNVHNFTMCVFDDQKKEKKLDYYTTYANIVLGMEREFDVSPFSEWGKKIIELKKSVSEALEIEIKTSPSLVKNVLGAYQKTGITAPDQFDIDELNDCVRLLHGIKNYISASLCNASYAENYLRAEKSIATFSNAIVDLLGREKPKRQQELLPYLDIAADLIGIIKGSEQAELYRKSGLRSLRGAILTKL